MDTRRFPLEGKRRIQGISHALTPACGRLRARLRLSFDGDVESEYIRRAAQLSQRAFQVWALQQHPGALPDAVELKICLDARTEAAASFDRIVVCAPAAAVLVAGPPPPIPVLPLPSGGFHADLIATGAGMSKSNDDLLRARTCIRTAVADVILTLYRHVPPSVDRLSLITGASPLVANAIRRIAAGWVGDLLCRSLLEHGLKRERTLHATSDLLYAALPNTFDQVALRLSPIPLGATHVALAIAEVLEQPEPCKSLVADLDCTFATIRAQIQMVAASHCARSSA